MNWCADYYETNFITLDHQAGFARRFLISYSQCPQNKAERSIPVVVQKYQIGKFEN